MILENGHPVAGTEVIQQGVTDRKAFFNVFPQRIPAIFERCDNQDEDQDNSEGNRQRQETFQHAEYAFHRRKLKEDHCHAEGEVIDRVIFVNDDVSQNEEDAKVRDDTENRRQGRGPGSCDNHAVNQIMLEHAGIVTLHLEKTHIGQRRKRGDHTVDEPEKMEGHEHDNDGYGGRRQCFFPM